MPPTNPEPPEEEEVLHANLPDPGPDTPENLQKEQEVLDRMNDPSTPLGSILAALEGRRGASGEGARS
jgi:hypothetical protein